MDLNHDLTAVTVRLHRCQYASPCRARNCHQQATTIAGKLDAVGRFVQQIELCHHHAVVVATRERKRGLEAVDEHQAS